MSLGRVAMLSGGIAVILTVAMAGFFYFVYRDCSELGCMAIVLFLPVAAIASLVAAIVLGARARAGGRGYAVALGAAALGVYLGTQLVAGAATVLRP